MLSEIQNRIADFLRNENVLIKNVQVCTKNVHDPDQDFNIIIVYGHNGEKISISLTEIKKTII